MLRTLLSPRWMAALAAATVFAGLCFLAGRWQWEKYVTRSTAADAIARHYDAPASPLEKILPSPATALPEDAEWTRVTAVGSYDGDQLLVRNRPLNGTYGYEVLAALRTAQGVVWVDRGWIPFGGSAAGAVDIPPAPTGQVQVGGWLRPGEHDLERNLPAGQVASINLEEAARVAGQPTGYTAYLVLGEEQTTHGTAGKRPTPLPRPVGDLGPHQAYAFQWWGALPLGFLLVLHGVRTQTRARQEYAGQRPAKVKRTRIWDEEDG